MNIFATSSCPRDSAKNLDDKRVIKMALESAQMLSSAIQLAGGSAPYKITHPNHPCSVWVRQSKENARWLYDHGIALCAEYSSRFHKVHKCEAVLLQMRDDIELLPNADFTMLPNCAKRSDLGIDCSHIQDVYAAYREYLFQRMLKERTNKRVKPRYGRKVMPYVTLKKIESSHDNLRTDEVYGFATLMPEEGSGFMMFSKSLTGDDLARVIKTSKITSVENVGDDEIVFRTQNSTYLIQVHPEQ